jgi:hypothetical protein
MKKTCILLLIVSVIFISVFADIKIINGEVSSTPEVLEDEQFIVLHTFWAFGGLYPICLFEAASGDFVQITISSINSDSDHPDDKYIIELMISSTNHSTTVVQGTQFNEMIRFNNSDTYNITAAKHPFYSSVMISGEVTVHHHLVPLTNNTPSTSTVPTLEPTLTPTPYSSNSTNSNTSTPSPSIPEFSWLTFLPIFIFTLSISTIVRLRKRLRITQL